MALKKVNYNEKQIYEYLYNVIKNHFGVSGLMGDLKSESNLRANNLQNSFETRLGITDDEYVNKVDNGTYTNFVKDSAGFGLWQLTYWSRKQGFLNYCKSKNASIGCYETQLEYLIIELENYKLLDSLKNAKSVREASDIILLKFERPADQSEAVQIKRASYGEEYYNKYATKSTIIDNKIVETPITNNTKKTNSGLVKYAKSMLGTPYWYGTYGQTATQSLYEAKKKQYPNYYTASDYASQYGKRVHDCVGLIKGYIWGSSITSEPKYDSKSDKSAKGMYSASSIKGNIDTFPNKIGTLVYKSKGSVNTIYHVGVYIGNNKVIEAKGHKFGTIESDFKNWQHWSQCPYIEDDSIVEVKEEIKQETIKEYIIYKVVKGDTLIKIGKKYNCSYLDIAKWSNIKNPNLITIGQELKIYQTKVITSKKEEEYIIHEVVKGDTLWGIAKKYYNNGSKYNIIMEDNNLSKTIINVGQKLKIRK